MVIPPPLRMIQMRTTPFRNLFLNTPHYSGNSTYAESAARMNSLLVQLQWNSRRKSSREMFGAISGSYPFWGRYEPFAFPNWATKYLADALMLEEQARKQ